MSTLEGQPPAYAAGYPGQVPQPQPGQPGQPIFVQPPGQGIQQQYVPYQGEGQPIMYAQQPPPGYVQGMPVQPQPGTYAQPYAADPAFGQQPYAGQQMMYVAQPVGGVYAQPVVIGAPASPQGATVVVVAGGQGTPYYLGFSDGLFDCFDDCTSCLLAYFVTPIRWALTLDRAGLLSFIIAFILYGIPFWAVVVLSLVTIKSAFIGWAIIIAYAIMITLGTYYRSQIRYKYGLLGSTFEDCCLHFWCTCCAVSQEARHVDRMTGGLPHSAYVQYR